jgi:hypothetical protein
MKPRAADKPQKERHRRQILASRSGQAAKEKTLETNFNLEQRTSRKRQSVTKAEQTAKFNEASAIYDEHSNLF